MNKLKIVHVVIDQKFIDGAISLFDTDERVENTYIIIGEKQECEYIKSSGIVTIDEDNAINFINQFDVVVLHSLPSIPISQIKNIRKGIRVIWFAWGYDLYEKPYDIIPVKLLGPETKRYIRRQRSKNRFGINSLRASLYVKLHLKSALQRIDYFSGVFPYEIDMVKAKHTEFTAHSLDFYYGSKDFFIPEVPSIEIIHEKYNIIIGNSANITGNHLDVLETIKTVSFDKRAKIIIPLSYGGTSQYIHAVEKKAEELAPGQVVTLCAYLPLMDYLNLISNCRTAVFAHIRQQATDNIFMQLIYGARVFMSESSYAFKYLKSIGIRIYSLEKDLHLFNKEMSDADVMNNRTILSSLYSSSKLIERVYKINSILINANNH